jgi:hypothetical protein
MFANEQFLLGRTETDEENVWSRFPDLIKNILQRILASFESIERAANANNVYAWVSLPKYLRSCIRRLRSAAKQEYAESVSRAVLTQFLDEVHTRDARNTTVAKGVACPDDGHSVRADVVGLLKTFAESTRLFRKNVKLGICGYNLPRNLSVQCMVQHFI